MSRTLFCVLFLILLPFTGTVAQGNDAPILEVRVEGIHNSQGMLGVAVFNQRTGYPVRLEHQYEGEWVQLKPGMEATDVTFDALPAGEYAISVVHDENSNGVMDKTTLGFPTEGVGFSNDCKVKLSAPKYDKCKFPLAKGERKKIVIQLDYRK